MYQISKIRIPIAGGFYFRFLPFSIFVRLLRFTQEKTTVVLYFHPHEFYNFFVEDIKLPFFRKTFKYWGSCRSLEKFEKLIKSFHFTSIRDFLKYTPNIP